MAELPFPISFEVPAGWSLVAPESAGHPEAAYVAVRDRNAAEPIATNFVVNGFGSYSASVDVGALADSHLVGLRSRYPVVVLKRDVAVGGPAPEAAQLLRIEYPVGEATVTVNQIQIINAFPGEHDPGATAVLQLLMTCPTEVFGQAGPEFTRFVGSISPLATGSGAQ